MEFDLENAKLSLAENVVESCTWVFDTDLCIVQPGVTQYNVSLNDRKRWDSQHIVSIDVPDFESAIVVLDSMAKAGGSVINGLGQSYNSLVKRESKTFVLNIYNRLHTDLAENHPTKNIL